MYYLVLVQNTDEEARALFAYDTMDKAEIAYHNELAAGLANEKMKTLLVEILDQHGEFVMKRYWERTPEEKA